MRTVGDTGGGYGIPASEFQIPDGSRVPGVLAELEEVKTLHRNTHIPAETAKLDALTAKVRTAINRLQEYRTALIPAAVTWQIDVREELRGV